MHAGFDPDFTLNTTSKGLAASSKSHPPGGSPTAHNSYTVERESLGWWYVVEGLSRAGKSARVVGCTLGLTLTSPSTLALDVVVPKVGAIEADRGGSRYKIAWTLVEACLS
jgi:hypothetical protein